MKKVLKFTCLIAFLVFITSGIFITVMARFEYINKFIIITLLLLLLLMSVMMTYTYKNLKISNVKNKDNLQMLICAVAAIWIIVGSPVKFDSFLKHNVIKIYGMAEKNIDAKSNEVWINEIKIDNKIYDLNTIMLKDNWLKKDNCIVFNSNKKSFIEFSTYINKSIQIKMLNHEWSGKAKVFVNDKEQDLDLYSSKGEVKSFNFSPDVYKISLFWQANLYISLFVYIYILFRIIFNNIYELNVIKKENKKLNKNKIFIYFLPLITINYFYFLAFYPGIMTPDSLDQWNQIQTLKFNGAHSIIQSFFNLTLTKLYNSPSIIILFQMVLISILIALFMYNLEKVGVKSKHLIVSTIIFAIFPMNNMMVSTLWKDIPYTAAIILLTLFIFKITWAESEWINNKINICKIIITLLFILQLRHNGIIPVFGTLILFIITDKKSRKKFLYILLITLISNSMINSILYNFMGISKISAGYSYLTPIHQVAYVINENGILSQDDLQMANEIMPIQLWKDNFTPYTINELIFSGYPLITKLEDDKGKVLKLWFSVAKKNKYLVLKDLVKMNSILWRFSIPDDGYRSTVAYGIIDMDYARKYNLKNYIIDSDLNSFIKSAVELSHNNKINIMWSPALYIFISIILGIIIVIKKGFKKILFLCPVLINSIGIIPIIPAQDYRYFYPSLIILPFVILLSVFKYDEIKY